ncbi:unnamed protein product, partial [Ectocarpus fasciculatus]
YFNRYSYTANDPVNFWDSTGAAFDRLERFPTIDDAARDLLEHAAQDTRGEDRRVQRERGGDIKKDQDTGAFYWDSIEVGDNDTIPIRIGDDTVAIAQTHPRSSGAGRGLENQRSDRRNNGRISQGDRRQVRQANRHLDELIPTYVGSYDGSITRFDPPRYRQGIPVAPPGTLQF